MKTIILFVLLTTVSTLQAEVLSNEELSAPASTSISSFKSYYISFNQNFTEIFKKSAYESALSFGIYLNSNVYAGIKLAYFTNYQGLYFDNVSNNQGAHMKSGFIGLSVEPVLHPQGRLHLAFPMTFAFGMVSFSKVKGFFSGSEIDRIDRSNFLLMQPGIELQVSIVKNITLGFGANYRHTSGLSIGDLPNDLLDGLNTGLGIKYIFPK